MTKVLFATTELFPYIKYGGLGDVAAALPSALLSQGTDIRYFLPGYQAVRDVLSDVRVVADLADEHPDAKLLYGTLPDGMTAYVLECANLFERPHAYLDENAKDWSDNHIRFGLFCKVAAQLPLYEKRWKTDVIHGNDWQCGLIPAYLHYMNAGHKPKFVMTLHNLCYQGLFPQSVLKQLDLPGESFSVNGLEYYNKVGFLKAGIYYGDYLTTVSPTYADEISDSELGYGLEGLISGKRAHLQGILNGIDQEIWNPEFDVFLKHPYNHRRLAQRRKNRGTLLQEGGHKDKKQFIIGFIGRLTPQKGIDLLLEAIPAFVGQNVIFIILGSGDAEREEACRTLAGRHPEHVALHIGYNEELSHRLYAAADALVVPSTFEPCGLVQLYALRYGAVPIVHKTGGLSDTVDDEVGFSFTQAKPEALSRVLLKAFKTFTDDPKQWQMLQRAGMKRDHGWAESAAQYVQIYNKLCKSAPLRLVSEQLVA